HHAEPFTQSSRQTRQLWSLGLPVPLHVLRRLHAESSRPQPSEPLRVLLLTSLAMGGPIASLE
ncbi:hypothetical protein, partial [Agromyces sp. SYSU T00266]|uniref:hypothetical protein n=1 Tax=Agromyces zhanjiangensis TaxID=3158562 RepID=UPI0033950A39